MCRVLAELASLATVRFDARRSIDRTLAVIQRRLAASEVSLIYGLNDGFRHFGTSGERELNDFALWLVNRDLTSRDGPCTFQFRDGRVHTFRPAEAGLDCDYVAALVPIPNTSAQMVVAKGPWPQGVEKAKVEFLVAAGPALALLLERRLDLAYAQKQRYQLSALMNITRVMSASEDLEDVLSNIAATIATVAEMDYVTIDIVGADGRVELRCVNYGRGQAEEPQDAWKRMDLQPDAIWRDVTASRRPMLFSDAQNDPRLPAALREFLARNLIRSSAVLPLVTKDEVIGILSVSSLRPTAFADADMELLDGLAGQVATAAKGIQLYHELAASQAALREKSLQLEHALETEREHARRDALTGALNHAALTEELRKLLSAPDPSALAVAMVDIDGMKAVNDTYGHLSGDAVLIAVSDALASAGAIVGRYGGDEFLIVLPGADRERAGRYRDDVLARLAAKRVVDADTGAVLPLVISTGLAVYPDEADTVTDLIKLSDSAMYSAKWQRLQATGDIVSSRSDERTARMIGELVPLLTSPGDLKDKLALVARRLAADAGYDAVDCQIYPSLLEPPVAHATAAGETSSTLARAWAREQQRPTRQPKLRPILARTRRPIILDDLRSDRRLSSSERKLLREAGLRSAIVAPMFWQDDLIGTLAVARREKNTFEPRDAQFVAAVANQVTAIVRMSALVEGLQTASARLAEAQAETVMMLAAAAEAHDRTTGVHLRSIRALSEALARELGYSERDVTELGLAAILHDIGKISVPDAVLSSPRRFDTEDWDVVQMWEVMKQHSVWGADFLVGKPGFELAAAIARWHHERWDGGGYPDGLMGEQIPERVAIVTVADAFDAMISDRPYRAGRPVSAAVREITSCSGRQFSPKVVAALVRLQECGELPSASRDRQAA